MRPVLDSHNSISSRNLSPNDILNPKHAMLEEFSQNHGHDMSKLSILDLTSFGLSVSSPTLQFMGNDQAKYPWLMSWYTCLWQVDHF